MTKWQRVLYKLFNFCGYEITFSRWYSPNHPNKLILHIWKK